MKKFLNIFFVILGVIFFIIILFSIYFYIADPFNLKSLFLGNETSESSEEVIDKNPALNESQEKAIETLGIDPSNVPSQFTFEQEACFVEKLGQDRVNAIKGGDLPTATDYLKAADCL